MSRGKTSRYSAEPAHKCCPKHALADAQKIHAAHGESVLNPPSVSSKCPELQHQDENLGVCASDTTRTRHLYLRAPHRQSRQSLEPKWKNVLPLRSDLR